METKQFPGHGEFSTYGHSLSDMCWQFQIDPGYGRLVLDMNQARRVASAATQTELGS